jgi:cell division protein FtsZ
VKQDFLPLEPIARGRFERSEPTIVEGEDLDVPTFLRLKIKK